jgi:hypothetical protein
MAKAAPVLLLSEMERVLIGMYNTFYTCTSGTFAAEDPVGMSTGVLVALPEELLLRLTARIEFDEWGVAHGIASCRPDVFPRWLRVVFSDRPTLKYFEFLSELAAECLDVTPEVALLRREIAACLATV